MTQITGKKEKEKERKKKGERSPIARTKLFCRFWPFRRECRVDSCANRVQPIHRGEWHCKGQSVARNVFATTTIKWTTWFCSRNWNYRIYVGDIYEAEPLAHHRVSKPGRLISSRVHGAPLLPATRSSRYVTIFQLRVYSHSSRIIRRVEFWKDAEGGGKILISRVVIVERERGVDSSKLKRGRSASASRLWMGNRIVNGRINIWARDERVGETIIENREEFTMIYVMGFCS